ncbi:hypothetical protein F4825DRAFT_444602, partial [Nemania diffusa]
MGTRVVAGMWMGVRARVAMAGTGVVAVLRGMVVQGLRVRKMANTLVIGADGIAMRQCAIAPHPCVLVSWIPGTIDLPVYIYIARYTGRHERESPNRARV